MTDLQHIRELAQKAKRIDDLTDGRWWLPGELSLLLSDTDAAFIAACSPDRILAMLDVCEVAANMPPNGSTMLPANEWFACIARLQEALARLRGAK
jgi:hypothetical protein